MTYGFPTELYVNLFSSWLLRSTHFIFNNYFWEGLSASLHYLKGLMWVHSSEVGTVIITHSTDKEAEAQRQHVPS